MWNFYIELCTGIPSGIRIEECTVGEKWTTVRANGNVGIARTMGCKEVDCDALAQSMVGTYLRDAANYMKWNSLARASIGVAAMNAFYNSVKRLEDCVGNAFDGVDGKKVVVIGDLPDVEIVLMGCASLVVLPLPECGDLSAEYEKAMKSDIVLISGDALINQTLPALLDLVGENTKVTLFGESVPAAAILFSFGNPVHKLVGVSTKGETTKAFVVEPVEPEYLHESAQVTRYENSPYKATKFNSAFNPWEGKEYDRSTWSDLFIG